MKAPSQDKVKEEFYELPFQPFEKPLKEVLLIHYIEPVAKWLIGKRANVLLAMEAESLWETGLSMLFLVEVNKELKKNKQEPLLKGNLVVSVATWLLSKKTESNNEKNLDFVYWDKVTWDTSVVIRSLLTMLDGFKDNFNQKTQEEIKSVCKKGVRWLYNMFLTWDKEVKYPFGPADLGQILTTILFLQEKFPIIYVELCDEFKYNEKTLDIATVIVKKLLSIKTEKTTEKERIEVTIDDNRNEVVTYWWDDYFSTAEVVEALALFYKYCRDAEINPSLRQVTDKGFKNIVKEALVRTCNHFEAHQVDGMWGNHIDTIKVIYAYVRIRDLIPKNENINSEALITPEIHTAFKALRWICDEKQIFKDNPNDANSPKSFMHTMYLTVFYAHALLEIYKSWSPVESTIGKIYDDVVWAAPVRSTPERAQRLALELKNSELLEKNEGLEKNTLAAKRISMLICFFAITFVFLFAVGKYAKMITFEVNFQQQGSSLDLISILIALCVIAVSVVFGINKLFKRD